MASRRKAKSSSSKWIQGAIQHPGALHRDLGVPQGKKIPVSKIRAAAKGTGVTARRARFALTLQGMRPATTAKRTAKKTTTTKKRKRK
jgi:hypothetical protein